MTWSKEVTLWCDGPGCDVWIQQGRTVAKAEEYAEREGWAKPSPGEHYCPDCGGAT